MTHCSLPPLKKVEMVLVPLGAYHFLLSTNNVTVLLFFGIVWLYQLESVVVKVLVFFA